MQSEFKLSRGRATELDGLVYLLIDHCWELRLTFLALIEAILTIVFEGIELVVEALLWLIKNFALN